MKLTQAMAGMSAGSKPPMRNERNEIEDTGGDHHEIHPHGDGSYHSVVGGEKTEHPTLHHAFAHIAAHEDGESKHHFAHHDGMQITSHHAHEGGAAGPHDHSNIEELKDSMSKFLGEEEHEDGGHSGGGEDDLYS